MNIKHLEVKRAYYADPENVVVEMRRHYYSGLGSGWIVCEHEPMWGADFDYRIKPKTIRIGEIDVPEPVKVALERGQKYWVVYFYGVGELVGEDTWKGDNYDTCWMRRGLIHLTQEAAELHAKALILVSGGTID